MSYMAFSDDLIKHETAVSRDEVGDHDLSSSLTSYHLISHYCHQESSSMMTSIPSSSACRFWPLQSERRSNRLSYYYTMIAPINKEMDE
jgi:hypothetical protein